MLPSTYEVETRIEAEHWWFRGRRRLIARELAHCGLSASTRILDVGSGTGANLRLLRKLGCGAVEGVDASDEAIAYCTAKGLGHVTKADITALPYSDESFDLVLAADVLEHVADDVLAARELYRVLRPGGRALVLVPAFASLWGRQDDVSMHLRRYRMRALMSVLLDVNFVVQRRYHFNYLLFLPIWCARRLIAYAKFRVASENQINNSMINAVLGGVFAFDIATAPYLRPPFGVSIFALAEKRI